ncbi:hypothetical protein [Umezawaea sp. Da 62-37]|uniref:hypothetical protein n=1 Tax=Umezawaea sp. Da 62-37 TaxID=3075927 RepID=UPI0028F6F697|nr:hypothetical protein [Umezawaea sp. Da 62-37]WNV83238.1 hypothetical protein RM788_34340 [Umezawaea sp. Da 62-37]
MAQYLTDENFDYSGGRGRARQVIAETWTAEQHRMQARRLLVGSSLESGGEFRSVFDRDAENRLAAAQVHALLALSLVDPFEETS